MRSRRTVRCARRGGTSVLGAAPMSYVPRPAHTPTLQPEKPARARGRRAGQARRTCDGSWWGGGERMRPAWDCLTARLALGGCGDTWHAHRLRQGGDLLGPEPRGLGLGRTTAGCPRPRRKASCSVGPPPAALPPYPATQGGHPPPARQTAPLHAAAPPADVLGRGRWPYLWTPAASCGMRGRSQAQPTASLDRLPAPIHAWPTGSA